MTNELPPQGLDTWTEENWNMFCSHFRANGREVQPRNFKGSFGGAEIATLVALASGRLTTKEVVGVYGRGALEMIRLWTEDARAGLIDEKLESTGVYSGSFLLVSFFEAKEALGI